MEAIMKKVLYGTITALSFLSLVSICNADSIQCFSSYGRNYNASIEFGYVINQGGAGKAILMRCTPSRNSCSEIASKVIPAGKGSGSFSVDLSTNNWSPKSIPMVLKLESVGCSKPNSNCECSFNYSIGN
jgi:hypothetical protein